MSLTTQKEVVPSGNPVVAEREKQSSLDNRILDEYGLIVCGWSGEWDTALRAAVERCPNRRYTTFWATRGEPATAAKKIIELRKGELIGIEGADSFFQGLAEKVAALAEFDKPHPLSTKLAVAAAKKYLADDASRIRLHDLVMGAVEKLYAEVFGSNYPIGAPKPELSEIARRMGCFEGLSETAMELMAVGCYWGSKKQEQLGIAALERLANPLRHLGFSYEVWDDLRLYPALLLLYVGGIAAIATAKYDLFASLLTKVTVRGLNEDRLAVFELETWQVMNEGIAKQLPGLERHKTPLSDRLFALLREPLRDYLPDDVQYERAFDRFEYLRALVQADLNEKRGNATYGQVGRFSWKMERSSGVNTVREIQAEFEKAGESWPPLLAMLFDGSEARFATIKREYDRYLQQSGIAWR